MVVRIIDDWSVGDDVICDLCGEWWSPDREGKGGIMFSSKACCPDCAPRIEESAKLHHEEHYIVARQPEDMTFYRWVNEVLRGGRGGRVTIFAVE